MWIKNYSKLDNSVNFIRKLGSKNEIMESRYVERDNHFIVYLSCMTGCDKACRFCHLTQTGQTSTTEIKADTILKEALNTLNYHSISGNKYKKVYFNFMARGEPLASRELHLRWRYITDKLAAYAEAFGLEHRINVSTIMPENNTGLYTDFKDDTVLYYSLYSIDKAFRKKWIPKALDPAIVFRMFRLIGARNLRVKLHWAFIKDENDNYKNTVDIARMVLESKVKIEGINIIRYNPYSSNQGKETGLQCIKGHVDILKTYFDNVKIIERVGFDINASCGMFVNE